MILDDALVFLRNDVFPVRPKPGLFNQYNDRNLRVDLPNADNIRRENLENYLKSFSKRPYVLVVGEAPGPWGARFSGVPFTTEKQLCEGKLPFTGKRSSKNGSPHPREKGQGRTAITFWKVMSPYHPKFFAWDCVPFHPHRSDDILSIRKPKRTEIREYSGLLSTIHELIKPKRIVAVGRTAEWALDSIGIESVYVRHPSRSGAKRFEDGIRKILSGL